MNDEELLQELLEILKEATDDPDMDVSKVDMNTNIFEEYHISSISGLYMALEIERRYGVSLINEDAESFRTAGGLIELIKSRKKN